MMRFMPANRNPKSGIAIPPARSEGAAPKLQGIRADVLIPGRGEPFEHGAVILHEDKIDWVGIQSEVPAKYKSLDFTHVPVMPGLWDCHVFPRSTTKQ